MSLIIHFIDTVKRNVDEDSARDRLKFVHDEDEGVSLANQVSRRCLLVEVFI